MDHNKAILRGWAWKIARTATAALAFLFLMGSFYILKPTRSPMINKYIGSEHLHEFYAANAIVSLLGIILYNYLVSLCPRGKLLRICFCVILIGFAILWGLFSLDLPKSQLLSKIIASAYFFFVCVYILFCTSLFWSFNHDIHTSGEAERFYPYINFGAQVGVILGAMIPDYFGKPTTQTLIMVSIAGILLCWMLLEILKVFDPNLDKNKYAKPKVTGTIQDIKLFFSDRYVLCIGLIVILATFIPTLGDFQFNWMLDSELLKDERAPYFCEEDFVDLPALATGLRIAEEPHFRELRKHLSDDTGQMLDEYDGSKEKNEELVEALTVDLNEAIEQPLYREPCFQHDLPPRALKLLESPNKSEELALVNRLLLESVYEQIGPSLVRLSDFKDFSAFVAKLKEPQDDLSRFLAAQLSPTEKTALAKCNLSQIPKKLQYRLLYRLDSILQSGKIYDSKRFENIELRNKRMEQIDRNLQGEELIILNKTLLEDAYGQEMKDSQQNLQRRFRSNMYKYMGLCNIVMCLLITPLLFRLLGPVISICLYPLILLAVGLMFLRGASLMLIGQSVALCMTLNYTLYNVGKEVFFVPTNKIIKYKIKAFCETFLFRTGDALSSLIVAIYLFFDDSWVYGLSYILFVAVILWIPVILMTGKKYKALVR